MISIILHEERRFIFYLDVENGVAVAFLMDD
jgi:hypothetical protein